MGAKDDYLKNVPAEGLALSNCSVLPEEMMRQAAARAEVRAEADPPPSEKRHFEDKDIEALARKMVDLVMAAAANKHKMYEPVDVLKLFRATAKELESFPDFYERFGGDPTVRPGPVATPEVSAMCKMLTEACNGLAKACKGLPEAAQALSSALRLFLLKMEPETKGESDVD